MSLKKESDMYVKSGVNSLLWKKQMFYDYCWTLWGFYQKRTNIIVKRLGPKSVKCPIKRIPKLTVGPSFEIS